MSARGFAAAVLVGFGLIGLTHAEGTREPATHLEPVPGNVCSPAACPILRRVANK